MRAIIVLPLLLVGCVQAENSSSLDGATYGGDAVRTIFGTNCTGCHHSFQTQSDDELIAAGLIVRGDALNSQLYYRIVGSSGPNSPKNMPPGGALSNADLETIKNWIDGL